MSKIVKQEKKGGKIMKKKLTILISIILLFPCMFPVTAWADSQSATLRYSVSATVIYRDYNGIQTTQKIEAGSTLKEPAHQDRIGYIFLGWKDESTGEFWNFADPVDRHLTLVACYKEDSAYKDGSKNPTNTGSESNLNTEVTDNSKIASSAAIQKVSPKTGDTSVLFGYFVMLLSAISVVAAAMLRKYRQY